MKMTYNSLGRKSSRQFSCI